MKRQLVIDDIKISCLKIEKGGISLLCAFGSLEKKWVDGSYHDNLELFAESLKEKKVGLKLEFNCNISLGCCEDDVIANTFTVYIKSDIKK